MVEHTLAAERYEDTVNYMVNMGYHPDCLKLIGQLVSKSGTKSAVEFAVRLVQNPSGCLVEPAQVTELLMQMNLVQETTSFLMQVLSQNRPEQAKLQTRLLEINLQMAPQVANEILEKAMFSHYDRAYIGGLCEQAGLYQRALEHYTELQDIKRVIVHTNMIDPKV